MSTRSPSQLNDLAKKLKSLHVSGQPLLLANVWDAGTAKAVASQRSTKAIATTSYAVAMTVGVEDNDLTLELNLQGITNVAKGLANAGKSDSIPLSADLQDGYASPAETIKKAIALGVVGCNLEDVDNSQSPPKLRSLNDAVSRIKAVRQGAQEAGVPDFVINARVDAFKFDADLSQVIERGKAFLEAGAAMVFVLGFGKHVITEDEVKQMVKAFDGKLTMQPGEIGIPKLREWGVVRISVGSLLWRKGMKVFGEEAVNILEA